MPAAMPYDAGSADEAEVAAAVDAEFDTVAGWTAAVARRLGPDYYEVAGCRGSGSPVWLDWLADRLKLKPGEALLDVGAGVGGPAAYAARTRKVRPILSEPQPKACQAARSLFDLPVICSVATTLPVASEAMPAVWCLGVLCTISERADQLALLRELRRVLMSDGILGMLVLVAKQTPIENQPIGNNFPTDSELDEMLEKSGFLLVDSTDTTELPPLPADWAERSNKLDAELERRYSDREGWQLAHSQSQLIGQLLDEGAIGTRLLVAKPA